MCVIFRRKPYLKVLLLLFLFCRIALAQREVSVQIYATWSERPAQITLNWIHDDYATNYDISRKEVGQDAFTQIGAISSNADSWTDANVLPGVRYEYLVHKVTGINPDGYGYLCAGIRAPVIENRGRLILLVEQSLSIPLSFGLSRFQQDLVGDGWTVLRYDISTNMPVTAVKDLIKSNYNADPVNTKSLLLFGHIPVPYSGDINPDGHADHRGAWPADVYYGEFDGQWTDTSVTATNVANPLNANVPGDGKFDQSEPPGKIRLQIGRIDLSRLTCFANKTPARSEIDLARQYLVKDHAFRHAQLNIPRRGLIYSRFGGLEEEPQAASGMRAFTGFFGPDQIKYIGTDQFLGETDNNAYLWTDVAGSGGMTDVDAVCTSDELATHNPKIIFSAWLGSYFGDWDRESNFLRAVIASGDYSLTSIYCGQPPWFFHPMSMGATIGEITQLTQNNNTNGIYLPHRNFGVGQVHIALMGDPTLRLHPVAPPQNLSGAANANNLQLQWTPSPDQDVLGYYIYRAPSAAGPFERISGPNAVNLTQFTDPNAPPNAFYMVRALKLENTPAGTYYNLSQGIFFPDPLALPTPPAPTGFRLRAIIPGGVVFDWSDPSSSATSFLLERRTLPDGPFQTAAQFSGFESSGADTTATRARFSYRLKSVNANGASAYTPEVQVNLEAPFALAAGVNTSLAGDWIGHFGEDGYVIYNWATNLPATLNLSLSNATTYINSLNTDNFRALQKPEPDATNRVMAVRSSLNGGRGVMEVNLRFLDTIVHRVAFYQIGEATGTLTAVDPFTGQSLASTTYYGTTNEGVYTIFDIRNSVNVVVSTSTNRPPPPEINGIFFSEATLDSPQIIPASGNFWGRTNVAILSLPGAEIHYTTDGTTPTSASPLYTAPFLLTTNATILARAYVPGYPDSPIAVASLTNALTSAAIFLRTDTTTSGDWVKSYGGDSSVYYGATPKYAGYADVAINDGTPFIWSDTTTETRALSKNSRDSRRLASCWYADDEISIDLTLYSESLHSIALYFLDWDTTSRSEEVTLIDNAGRVLDQRPVDAFTNGKYLVWNARGSIHVRIRRLAGNNVVLSGIFIGPAQELSQAPAHLDLNAASAGSYNLHIEGLAGQTFDIQTSTDFTTWTTLTRTTLTSTSADFPFAISDAPQLFYRAILSSP